VEVDAVRFRDFQALAERYDAWFEEHEEAYLSELEAIRSLMPGGPSLGLEVGVGTGRFASELGVQVGVDPAIRCLELARRRGIQVVQAVGEELPFRDGSFDLILVVVSLCFMEDPDRALSEVGRVLRPGGRLILGIVDKESFLGRAYMVKKSLGRPFYRDAHFLSAGEAITMVEEVGLEVVRVVQTVFDFPDRLEEVEEAREGHGEGGFVVVSALKPSGVSDELSRWLSGVEKLVVMGIGNPMRHDDAVGLELARALRPTSPPEQVVVLECGPVPENFLGKVIEARPTHVLMVDAGLFGGRPGEARLVRPEEARGMTISTHRISPDILASYIRRSTNAEVALLLIQPLDIGLGEGLSSELEAAIRRLAGEVSRAIGRALRRRSSPGALRA